jgi:hypothetical protein
MIICLRVTAMYISTQSHNIKHFVYDKLQVRVTLLLYIQHVLTIAPVFQDAVEVLVGITDITKLSPGIARPRVKNNMRD